MDASSFRRKVLDSEGDYGYYAGKAEIVYPAVGIAKLRAGLTGGSSMTFLERFGIDRGRQMKNIPEENNTQTSTINTIVGKGSVAEGVYHINGGIRIDGELKGELSASDTVTVGPSGDVNVDMLKARNVVIGGRVTGKLEVSGHTHFQATSVFVGELRTRLLVVDEGAVFHGELLAGTGRGDDEEGVRVEQTVESDGVDGRSDEAVER